MRAFFQWLLSSVGKKYLLAGSGLALFGFLVTHLAANLLLLVRDGGRAFNTYPHNLEKWGALLEGAELGLLGVFLLHVALAIGISMKARRARGGNIGHSPKTKGGASHLSLASRSMIFTGLFILVFLVIHLVHFKYGAGVSQGYITDINGEPARDLYRLVVESFSEPGWVAFYVIAMAVLGFHLRHGIWSAFQSLGWMSAPLNARLYLVAMLLAAVMAGGFALIPLVLFLRGGSS